MKIVWKGFEFEIANEEDLKLFKLLLKELVIENKKPNEKLPTEIYAKWAQNWAEKDPILQEYKEWLEEQGYAESTIHGYLKAAAKYLLPNKPIPKSMQGKVGLSAWKRFCEEKGLKRSKEIEQEDDDDMNFDLRKMFLEEKRVLDGVIR